MVTIAKQPDERLIEFLHRELGDQLRAVVRFDTDGCEPLFLREDLGQTRLADAITERCERIVAHANDQPIGGLVPPSAGDTDCLVGLVGDVIVLLLYRNETDGVAVSVDRTGDLPFTPFFEDCLTRLR